MLARKSIPAEPSQGEPFACGRMGRIASNFVTHRMTRMLNRSYILKRFPGGRKAIVNEANDSELALLFFHGAGLEPTSDFYLNFADALPAGITYLSPFLSASHFLAFSNDFRRPNGWACHEVDEIIDEARSWLAMMASLAKRIVIIGHSWGAYLAATVGTDRELFLISPTPDLRSIVDTNIDIDHDRTVDSKWMKSRDGAPFPFLSSRTITSLSGVRPHLSEIINAST